MTATIIAVLGILVGGALAALALGFAHENGRSREGFAALMALWFTALACATFYMIGALT